MCCGAQGYVLQEEKKSTTSSSTGDLQQCAEAGKLVALTGELLESDVNDIGQVVTGARSLQARVNDDLRAS